MKRQPDEGFYAIIHNEGLPIMRCLRCNETWFRADCTGHEVHTHDPIIWQRHIAAAHNTWQPTPEQAAALKALEGEA